ncbi:hypothetical protein B0T22DRAFT_162260 [Podospora appendiculata]|uniref:FAD-binding domain-containing protein n=1 Tax=Podospora appendiculata TaxID=314037 RepID=A0AAE0XAD1_9PEZI|nr:hypothetical protein B0T22DRAFT_162260 [Podospora appendiculata]
MPAAPSPPSSAALRIAIIGGGIAGVNLALGLQARNLPFTLYERASGFREIGAGIGFSPNAERAMGLLNPDVLATFKRVANPNGEDYFRWANGYETDAIFFSLYLGKDGFQGARRSDILEEWARLIPDDKVVFSREVDTIDDNDDGLTIRFKDGTTADADVVIGCDGIRSRIRQLVLPPKDPQSTAPNLAAIPHYSSKFCFRALVPMDAALGALGPDHALKRVMYCGPSAHIVIYPVGNNSVLNVLVVLSDPLPWPDAQKYTARGSRSEALASFADWQPSARKVVNLLPAQMDKWAIFDMYEHPAPSYVRGRVCVAGDAAHAMGPHLGAGGGMGIEDALVLSAVLERAEEVVARGREATSKREVVERALRAYEVVRYERTQKIVRLTREAVDLIQWRDPEVGRDADRFGPAITQMFHYVWDYDVEEMVHEAVRSFEGGKSVE